MAALLRIDNLVYKTPEGVFLFCIFNFVAATFIIF